MTSARHKRAQDTTCEEVENNDWDYHGTQKTCFMDQTTEIESPGIEVAEDPDDSIKALHMGFNKQIHFLPSDVCKSFPELIVYYAPNCSLTSIDKSNFENLYRLEMLLLRNNKIELIRSDTFEDLISLKRLSLSGNKIKFMNQELFREMRSLEGVWMQKNDCIDHGFHTPATIAEMPLTVSQRCGFNETTESANATAEPADQTKICIEKQDDVLQTLKMFINETAADKENCLVNVAHLQADLDMKLHLIQKFSEKLQDKTRIVFELKREVKKFMTKIEQITDEDGSAGGNSLKLKNVKINQWFIPEDPAEFRRSGNKIY